MKTVWKYPLKLDMDNLQRVQLPAGAVIQHVNAQNDIPTMWAEVNPDRNVDEVRYFSVVATGASVPDKSVYIGTIHIDWTVWHIYEVGA